MDGLIFTNAEFIQFNTVFESECKARFDRMYWQIQWKSEASESVLNGIFWKKLKVERK